MPRDPLKRKANDTNYRARHPEKLKSYASEYNSSNRAAIKSRKVGKYDRLFGWDDGWTEWALDVTDRCGICGEPFDDSRSMGKAVDHDHQTGRFRGIVHNRCNVGIGFLQDSEDLCLKAAAYLKEDVDFQRSHA